MAGRFRKFLKAVVDVVRRPPARQPEPPPEAGRYEPPESTELSEWQPSTFGQQIWDDTAADIASNVEMETEFVRFIDSRYDKWRDEMSMPANHTRALISWFIINAGIAITHDDITVILDRIYDALRAR